MNAKFEFSRQKIFRKFQNFRLKIFSSLFLEFFKNFWPENYKIFDGKKISNNIGTKIVVLTQCVKLWFQMKEIALKMDRVDKEFQKKEFQIFQLDSQLQDAHAVIRGLSSKLNEEKNCQKNNHEFKNVSQKQIRDLQELKEFLHVENATLLETLKGTVFENYKKKSHSILRA